MKGQADTYKEVKTFESPGWVIRVHIPDLNEDERAKRRKELAKATARFLKGVADCEAKK